MIRGTIRVRRTIVGTALAAVVAAATASARADDLGDRPTFDVGYRFFQIDALRPGPMVVPGRLDGRVYSP